MNGDPPVHVSEPALPLMAQMTCVRGGYVFRKEAQMEAAKGQMAQMLCQEDMHWEP